MDYLLFEVLDWNPRLGNTCLNNTNEEITEYKMILTLATMTFKPEHNSDYTLLLGGKNRHCGGAYPVGLSHMRDLPPVELKANNKQRTVKISLLFSYKKKLCNKQWASSGENMHCKDKRINDILGAGASYTLRLDKELNTDILRRTQMTGMQSLLMKRQLRWCGHIVKINDDRLPSSTVRFVDPHVIGLTRQKSDSPAMSDLTSMKTVRVAVDGYNVNYYQGVSDMNMFHGKEANLIIVDDLMRKSDSSISIANSSKTPAGVLLKKHMQLHWLQCPLKRNTTGDYTLLLDGINRSSFVGESHRVLLKVCQRMLPTQGK
ncbi:hypothetical protein O3G_MSEX005791 [Manduca sexta]|uniref:Uncharacterized protein n=1 Tax=Manduca sexta TaxID=7130 RepID=A0A922CJZ5_MANSE|nr:hypothetical protein O3G_MSEX005791 [Manduca sexta]